jgi:hypothetical protein
MIIFAHLKITVQFSQNLNQPHNPISLTLTTSLSLCHGDGGGLSRPGLAPAPPGSKGPPTRQLVISCVCREELMSHSHNGNAIRADRSSRAFSRTTGRDESMLLLLAGLGRAALFSFSVLGPFHFKRYVRIIKSTGKDEDISLP